MSNMTYAKRYDVEDEGLEEKPVSIGQQEQVLKVTATNFGRFVTNSPLPVLVNFQTPRSKQMVPLLSQLAETLDGRLRVVQVNIATDPELAARFKIRAVPTLLIFKHGVPVEFIVGTVPSRFIFETVCKALGVAPRATRVQGTQSSLRWPSIWAPAYDSTCA
jgi:thioredoxin 1